LGASTVTCGTVTVGAAPVGGLSGAPCCGVSAGGVGGVSGAGVCGVVGVSGAGVCDAAPPAKQSSMSAELLSSSNRLLRIHMTLPPNPPTSTHRGVTSAACRTSRSPLARALADTSAMSGERRCACLEERGLWRRQLKFGVELEPRLAENVGQRHRRRLGRHQCAGEMDQCANRAAVVRVVFTTGRSRRRVEIIRRCLRARKCSRARCNRRDVLEMHVTERNGELERQRKQRQIRAHSRTRPEPAHRRQLRVSHRADPFCQQRLATLGAM
jgi:hypothetical protein